MSIDKRPEIKELQEMGYEITHTEESGGSIWVTMLYLDEERILTVEIAGEYVWVNGTPFDEFIEEEGE